MLKSLMRNKKGSIVDLIYIAGGLLFFSMVVLISYRVFTEVNTNIQANGVITNDAKTASTDLLGLFPGLIDNMFLFVTIGLGIIMLIFAALVRIHPVFIFIFLFLLPIIIYLGGAMSNVYQELADDPNLSTQADRLIIISTIMEYFPFIIGVFGIILMFVSYKVWRMEQ